MDLFYSMLIYLYYFGRPVVLLAGLILSIIIFCTKDRMTKLLGIWLIVSDIGGLLGSVYVLMIRFISRTEIAGRLSTFNTMVTAFLGIVGAVIFALYAIKKYGFKLYWKQCDWSAFETCFIQSTDDKRLYQRCSV